jgi:uncharacterized membrane protein
MITPLLAAAHAQWMRQLASFAYFFYDPVCHQITHRSFSLQEFPFPVCVRCLSIYIAGFLLALSMFRRRVITSWSKSTYFFFFLPAVLDFILEKIHIYNNLPFTRFITGFSLGIALFHLLIFSFTSQQPTVIKAAHIGCLTDHKS